MLFLAFLTALGSFANTDSLRLIWENETLIDGVRFQALDAYYEQYSEAQPDSALRNMEYYYNLAKTKNAKLQVFRSLNSIGSIYRNKSELDSALIYYNQAAFAAIELKDPVLLAIIQGNIGNIYYDQKKYLEATRKYATALKVFQVEKDKDGEGRMLSSLASINNVIGNYEIALEYYQKALDIYAKIEKGESGVVIIIMNIGLIHFYKEDYEASKSSFLNALELLNEENDIILVSGCYSLLAQIYYQLNDHDNAKFYAEKNLALNKEFDKEMGIMDAEVILSQVIFETDVDSALKKGELLLEEISNETPFEIRVSIYELLYNCYKSQNKPDAALKMHELFVLYEDSLQIEKNSFAVARELVKNDYELRFYENKLANEKEKMALRVAQLKRTYGIAIVSIVLILGVIVYFRSKMKKNQAKRNLLLAEIERLKNKENEKLMVSSNEFQLVREKIEHAINRKLNETDWKVLNVLLGNPVITNKEIAEQVFMSVDGIGSSLRRMYEYFNIKESKYKKISLLLEAVKYSNSNSTAI